MLDLPLVPLYTQENCPLISITSETNDSLGMLDLAVLLTVLFTITVFLFEVMLDFRQRSCYRKTEFPQQLKSVVSKIDAGKSASSGSKKQEATEEEEKDSNSKVEKDELFLPQLESKFQKSQIYGTDKIMFSIASSTYETFETVFFLLVGFLPYAWDLSVRIGKEYIPYKTVEGEIGVSLIFVMVVQLVGMVTSLPFELYSTFHIEKKHGFNKQTYSLFFSDKVKSLLLTCVLGLPFVALLLFIIQKGGENFYLYVWVFMFFFSVFMMTLVPVFIMPLFNKYEPLKDGVLKERIFALAARLNYPLTKLFVMDGSKRSSHSNAFMFGFGKNKRIVIFDTLMTQVHDDEILGILGHELGHWKLGHTLTNFVVTQVYFGAAFYCFSLFFGSYDLYSAFGFDGPKTPTIIALLLFFQTLWAPIDKILNFVLTVFSRHCEFAADEFSHSLGMNKELQTGLCKIHLENLGAMCPDPLYSTYHYSHPPLVERLTAMMDLDKKSI
eukprot:CAMPEP_0195527818 /NCGR_PEP_ID=MMETSP0794_2-20130614/29740_1 /TAXON_ID=515487 /ORGANISM="Stephanopyxis turris, Strain CCMP 815" /LENGTH=496 /DNA_ID=CAMNT_0040658819 /DNA_START=220 /DNA_END=1710 /DNA_ORIENTATION=-